VAKGKSRSPLWARLCLMVGLVLLLLGGGSWAGATVLVSRYDNAVTKADLFGDAAASPEPTSELVGPLNILLVGIDPRDNDPTWIPRADSVLILHVPASMDRAYLCSLPRDLLVDIPAFKKSNYFGGRDKLTHAMFFGAQPVNGGLPDAARGFELLSKTVSNYTGIEHFDAGAIMTFTGFLRVVNAIGGVTMNIDENVTSIHMQPDGKHRTPANNGGEGADAYLGPQKQYHKGEQHLQGWEALDYVRQRYIEGGDYARQRHQQQFIRAMANQALSKHVASNPLLLDRVLRAAGSAVTFNGRGHSVVDFALALRHLRTENITMIKLMGGGVGVGSAYQGEQLQPSSREYFAALRKERVESFLFAHPELINTTR